MQRIKNSNKKLTKICKNSQCSENIFCRRVELNRTVGQKYASVTKLQASIAAVKRKGNSGVSMQERTRTLTHYLLI